MNNINFVDEEEDVRSTNSRALRSKKESKQSIRERYYNWRIKRKEEKVDKVQEKKNDFRIKK